MSIKIAFLFPGQGSQYVGMGKEFWDNFDSVRSLYAEASEVLGYDLRELSFNGPVDELNKTFRTQPCLITASIAAYKVLTDQGVKPYVVAGHSLGEYSALVAAGVIQFRDAVMLTEKRGLFMQESVPAGAGLMAAIIGLSRNKVDDICLSVESGYVSPANYNCPGQIVIAGEKKAVEEAMKLARDGGAKRAIPLAVSAPSHCTLMLDASNRLGELLPTIPFRDTEIPVVNNADAMFITSADKIKLSLIKQLNSPLLWEDSIRKIVASGINVFVEVGPGKVLSGLVKRIDPSVNLFNVEDIQSLTKTIDGLNALQ